MKISRNPRLRRLGSAASAVLEPLEERRLLSATKIMPLGDSITESAGGHASYSYWLWMQLQQRGYDVDFVGDRTGVAGGQPLYPDFDQDHEGWSGWRADQIKEQAAAWADLFKPDIVLLHIGTNDIHQGQSNTSTVADVADIIDNLRVGMPTVKVLLAQIIPSSSFVTQTVNLNGMLPDLADQKSTGQSPVVLVDQYTGFSIVDDTYDGIHPDESGEQRMSARWYTALQSVLPPTGELPAAPTDLQASSPIGSGQVNLNWTENASDEEGLRIERKTAAGGIWMQVADLPADTRNWSDISGPVQGTTYCYRVYAYRSGARSGYSNQAVLRVPLPLGTRYLSDLELSVASNGWGPPERDHSNGEQGAADGQTITLNGATYAKGLGVHPFSDISVDLGGQCTRFVSDIGVDDEVGNAGSVVFHIYVDGVLVYNSGLMTGSSATKTVDLVVADRSTLRLIVLDGEDGNGLDHADWAGARVIVSVPTAPADLHAVAAGRRIALSWTDASIDEAGFRIQRRRAVSDRWSDIGVLPANATSYSDNSLLLPGAEYRYRVVAFNVNGDSLPCNEASITTPPATSQVYLTELTSTYLSNGWGAVAKDPGNKVLGNAGVGGGGDIVDAVTARENTGCQTCESSDPQAGIIELRPGTGRSLIGIAP